MAEITISDLGSLGEFVGAIAVVGTLFYLAIQVKHGKEATEANTRSLDENRKIALVQRYQATRDAQIANQRLLVDSPHMPKIALKALDEGVESLSEEEAYRMQRFSLSTVLILDVSYFAYQNGLEPDFPRRLKVAVRNSGHIWRHSKVLDLIQPGLKIEIERVLDEVKAETQVEA